MPSPIPFMASFPPKTDLVSVQPKEPVSHLVAGDGSNRKLHYRSFSDFMKLNLPADRLHADQHYDGPTGRHVCKRCKPEVSHRSAAALLRHVRMLH